MRCYCTSPDNCTCDGIEGTLTEAEVRLEIIKERKWLYGGDAADQLIAKVEGEIAMKSWSYDGDVTRLTGPRCLHCAPHAHDRRKAARAG